MGVVSNWEIVHSEKKLDLELKSWFKYPTFPRHSVEIAKLATQKPETSKN